MKASLTWMNEFVPVDMSRNPQELADILTQAGIPVEDVINMDPGLKKIYTGRIVEITKHPDADKLQVCQVACLTEEGEAVTKQIVTAATNVAVGQIVPVAYHKSRLADGTEIKKGKLRGQVSEGMFCSINEFGISKDLVQPEEATGIYIFPEGTPIGKDVRDLLMLNDYVYEFELTANRGDCFSMVGLSREFAILTGQKAKFPEFTVDENDGPVAGRLAVEIDNQELCQRFMTRLVTNVKVGPSPLWMQNCLRNSGIRPTNNVVDVTNFVMLELGQPMHAYDYDHIKGHQLTARLAEEGEVIQTLDGTDRELTPDMLVIADAERPVGVAGVMGGFDSEVTNETTSVVFEAAVFKPSSIRRTAKALGLRSEASGRYERGVNAEFTAIALDQAAQLLQKICPEAKVAQGVIDVYPIPQETVKISFTADQVNAYLGTDIPESSMEEILTDLEFHLEKKGHTITATVPSWRNDCTVMPDIAEEVGRIYGYDNIVATTPRAFLKSGSMTDKKALEKEVKHFLASIGGSEIITFSFMHKDGLANMLLPESDSRYTAIPIMNPISEEFPYMRTSLVPAVIEAAIRNLKQKNRALYLFEVGNVYEPKALPLIEVPHERPMLTGLAINELGEDSWNTEARQVDFYDVKGAIDSLLNNIGLKEWDVRRSTEPYMHPGVSAQYLVSGKVIANFGELHPQVVKNFDLPNKAYIFEVDLEAIMAIDTPEFRYVPFSKFPGTARDLAIVAPNSVSSQDILDLIHQYGGQYLTGVHIFDVYQGEHIEEGFRSIAYNLQFRSMDGTLNDEDIDQHIDTIVEKLADINCKLRD